MASEQRLRLRVSGRVQAVGFRWWAAHEARALELAGTVRNAADGTVEIEASGDGASLAQFVEQIRRGPPAAHVAEVAELEAGDAPLPRPFRIVH
ncbi:MAG: acylphosphatase [Longimicrobiales bacterium]